MKKALQYLSVFLMGLGLAVNFAVIIIAKSLGRNNLGETLGNIGLVGLAVALFGLVLGVVSLFFRKSSKIQT